MNFPARDPVLGVKCFCGQHEVYYWSNVGCVSCNFDAYPVTEAELDIPRQQAWNRILNQYLETIRMNLFRRPIYLHVELPREECRNIVMQDPMLLDRVTDELIEQMRKYGVKVRPVRHVE